MSIEWYSNWECDDEIICPYCGKKYEPTYEETYIGGKDVDCYKEGEQGEFTCDECGREKVLDKIRAEIDGAKLPKNRMCFFRNGIECALQIIDKYKAESEVDK